MALRAVLLALVLLAALPAAAVADVSISQGAAASDIAASGGDFAYTVGSRGRLALKLGFGPSATAVPVRRAANFRGLDLGTDSAGRRVLTYSRCEGRCDLFAYTLATRKERKLASLSRSACTERNPRMVHGDVAFVREERRSRKRKLRCTGGIYLKRRGHRLQRVSSTQASALDYDGRLLAYNRVRFNSADPNEEGEPYHAEIRVLGAGSPGRVLAAAVGEVDRGGSNGTFLGDVALDAGQVYWTRSVRNEETGGQVEDVLREPADASGGQHVLDRTGRLWVQSDPAGQDQPISALAVDGPRLFYGYGSFNGRVGQVAGSPVFH
jgi:hypothetical protein